MPLESQKYRRVRIDTKDAPRILYQSLRDIIDNETQLIWNRYNAMLTANAFTVVLLGAVISANVFKIDSMLSSILLIGVSLFGFLLSLQWKKLTKGGWELAHSWIQYVRENVDMGGLPNPYQLYQDWCKKHGCGEGVEDVIGRTAINVINLFIAAYVVILLVGGFLFYLRFVSG